MPGRLFLTRSAGAVAKDVGRAADAPEIQPRRNIQPGQDIVTLASEGWQMMRWGLIPTGRVNARGRPVMETIVNARSETVFDKSAFEAVSRAVVPADGWYEWTGKKGRKTPWRITRKDGDLMWFAAIWDSWTAPGGVQVPQVATLTRAPTQDVSAIHDRMGVILSADGVTSWLTGSQETARNLFEPWPNGTFEVQEAQDVDWLAP